MADMQRTLVTREGLEKMQKELDELRSKKRGEVAQRLKEAISMGDLSENSEYDDAKNEQSFVEGRILELETKIRTAVLISQKKKGGRVDLASTVTIEDLGDESQETVTIVGSTESDPFEGKISNESPAGRALMGSKLGDIVEVDAPNGLIKYKIIGIDGVKLK